MSGLQSFSIGLTCCFCGGKLAVDEASRTVRCPHCASLLKVNRASGIRRFVITESLPRHQVKFSIDRHLKKAGEPLASRWHSFHEVYIPFWRVNGTVFAIQRRPDDRGSAPATNDLDAVEEEPGVGVSITQREISFAANEDASWGVVTLGVRTQTVEMEPLAASFGELHRLVAVTIPEHAASQRFGQAARNVSRAVSDPGVRFQIMVPGAECDLIYFPIWVVDFANSAGRFTAQFDPVARRVWSITEGEAPQLPSGEPVGRVAASITIIPHRCPNCGDDLPASPRSVTYFCGNCRRMYAESERGYRPLAVRMPPDIGRQDTLFPFWVFDLSKTDWREKTNYAQVCFNLGFQDRFFVVPAFAVANPQRLLRLIEHYNRHEDMVDVVEYPNRSYAFADCAITTAHALSLIPPLIRAALANREIWVQDDRETGTPNLPEPELVWMPFRPDRYFWRERITEAAIERAAVRIPVS